MTGIRPARISSDPSEDRQRKGDPACGVVEGEAAVHSSVLADSGAFRRHDAPWR